MPRYERTEYRTIAGHIEVHVSGISKATGKVLVALYDRSTWLKEEEVLASGVVAARGTDVRVSLEHVPKGRYAVAVLDDEDDNGTMSWGLFGPTEPYGFSRDARGTLGPPSFDDAAFDFDGSTMRVEVVVK